MTIVHRGVRKREFELGPVDLDLEFCSGGFVIADAAARSVKWLI